MPTSSTSSDRKSTRLNSSHGSISYAVFCLKKKKERQQPCTRGEISVHRDPFRQTDCSGTLPLVFFFNDTATTEIYTLSLHDALPISPTSSARPGRRPPGSCRWHR